MSEVFVVADNIISPVGFNTDENFKSLLENKTGISKYDHSAFSPEPVNLAYIADHKIDKQFSTLGNPEQYTKTEKLLLCSIHEALTDSNINYHDKKTLFIISTTKGNIDLLEDNKKDRFPHPRLYLWSLADIVQYFFNTSHKPLVVSNACISGVMAIIMASRFIKAGQYDHVVVSGVDIISQFVVSGFQSFKAISENHCKPFDKNRDGISLGEGCGTVVLSSTKNTTDTSVIKILGGSVSNDANHISGPSRTGEGLYQAIRNALTESNLTGQDIDYLNAHGTATIYNDEMESKAFALAGLSDAPTNSLKGYYGHTLGAAGTIESILTIQSMKQNTLIKTLGFKETGVTEKLNIIDHNQTAHIQNSLKTASGFGGCNAAIVFTKHE